MIIPEWLFKESVDNKIKILENPKSLKQIAIEKIKLDDKLLNKELAEKVINPYFFPIRMLQVGFNITLKSHHINHSNFQLNIEPNYPEFGIEVRDVNKIIKEITAIYSSLINHYKFTYQSFFSKI